MVTHMMRAADAHSLACRQRSHLPSGLRRHQLEPGRHTRCSAVMETLAARALDFSARVRRADSVADSTANLVTPAVRIVHVQRGLDEDTARCHDATELLCSRSPFREAELCSTDAGLPAHAALLQRLRSVPALQAQVQRDVQVRHIRLRSVCTVTLEPLPCCHAALRALAI